MDLGNKSIYKRNKIDRMKKYLYAFGLLLLQPFKFLGEALLVMSVLIWTFSGCGLLIIAAMIADTGHLGFVGWFIIIIDSILLILYSIDWIKEKAKKYERAK